MSLRLKDDQARRLERAARRFGRTVSETAALLLEEALRQAEFAFVEFRDTSVGRQASLKGSRLAVWQVVSLARSFDGDVERTASHLEVPTGLGQRRAGVRGGLYLVRSTRPSRTMTRKPFSLRRLVPNLEVVVVDAAAP